MNLLRGLTYRSKLLDLGRSLGLTKTLREFYYRSTVSADASFQVRVEGVTARFYAHNSRELRGIEGHFAAERDFLAVLITALRPGDVVFDIGSNVGQFAIPMAKIVKNEGQIVAFEPGAEACEVLRSHIALNGLTNVRVFEKALGDANGSGELFFGSDACPSLLLHSGDAEQASTSETVQVVQGDWLVRTEALPIPRAVKIDVEGFEYSVLRGLEKTLANPACELLCCEIHPAFLPADVTPEMIVAFVNSVGFRQVADLPSRRTQMHMIARKGPAERGAN